MIYQIQNGKLVKSVAKNGKKYHRKHKRNNNKNRNKKIFRFYQSTLWQHKSRAIRKREPLCRACVREYHAGKRPLYKIHLADSVDHIKPLKTKDGYRHRLDDNNLQPLCHYHHVLKDKRDKNVHVS